MKKDIPLMVVDPTIFNITKHNMKRRARWHDYSRPGTYHITIVTEGRRPLFGALVGTADNAAMRYTPFGAHIYYKEINRIHGVYNNVEVWRKCVMPDHIHLIIHVSEAFPKGKHLGNVIAGFKSGCNRVYRQMVGDTGKPVFEEGYNDHILYGKDHLDKCKRYLADNPRRLAIKRANPALFVVRRCRKIAGHLCECVGNQFLLDSPQKMAVIVRSRCSDAEYQQKRRRWLACGANGGVLVSAAISPREKAVLREAFERGYKIILLRKEGFPQIYKPSGRSFFACAEGLLLQVSPWVFNTQKEKITRTQCITLNNLASDIAGEPRQF